MLIIAYSADAGFLERASFAYQFELRLVEMDQLLADDRLVLRVSLDLVESAAHATETGRPATPAEVTLRLAVLRRLMGWSYRKLEEEVEASLKLLSSYPESQDECPSENPSGPSQPEGLCLCSSVNATPSALQR